MDPILTLAQLLLLGLSLLGVTASAQSLLVPELLRIGVSLLITLIASRLSSRFLIRYSKTLFLANLVLLVITLKLGRGPAGVHRWFYFHGFSFQPSELMKVVLVIYLAGYFEQWGTDYPILGPTLAVALSAGLVLIEPDFATGAFILFLAGLLMVLIGVPWRRLFAITASATLLVLAFSGLYLKHFHYVSQRFQGFLAFLHGQANPLGQAYQVLAGQRAILAAGLFGRGPGAPFPPIPVASSDMVAASVIWAGGWLSGLMLMFAYGLIFARGLQITAHTQGAASVLALGMTGYIVLQAALNFGVVLGVLPVTGVPMPLVSYGGTSMLIAGGALGLLHSLSRETLLRPQAPVKEEAP